MIGNKKGAASGSAHFQAMCVSCLRVGTQDAVVAAETVGNVSVSRFIVGPGLAVDEIAEVVLTILRETNLGLEDAFALLHFDRFPVVDAANESDFAGAVGIKGEGHFNFIFRLEIFLL